MAITSAMIRITLILFLLAIAVPASVLAHPFTDTTVPEQFSNAPEGTDRVIVTYSEAIEIDFSSLKVYDSGGLQIDQRNTAYYDGINSLVVNTKPLGEGVYTVTSKVLQLSSNDMNYCDSHRDRPSKRYISIRSVSSIFLLYNPHTKNDMITPPSIIVCPMYPGIIATASG